MVDYESICSQLGIPFWTSGKNNVEGCLTIHCPCCPDDDPDPSRHGNLDPKTGKYSCWRCKGSHPAVVIAKASGISVKSASELIARNSRGSTGINFQAVEYAKTLEIPGSARPMEIHTRYLSGRGFDVDELIFYYGLKFTGMLEKWDGTDWGYRAIIPISDIDGNLVSFQGRDCTGKSAYRYLFPRKEKQIRDSKTLLYGSNLCKSKDSVIVVEGVADAWKLGPGSVCTFGSSVTREQILEMSRWRNVYLAFDNEPTALSHAREVAEELSLLGVKAYMVNTDFGLTEDGKVRDVGDLSTEDAKHFRDSIFKF